MEDGEKGKRILLLFLILVISFYVDGIPLAPHVLPLPVLTHSVWRRLTWSDDYMGKSTCLEVNYKKACLPTETSHILSHRLV